MIQCSDFPRPALKIFTPFWARSQNCEKRLLALSYLPVRLSVYPPGITPRPLDGFSLNFIFDYFAKIC
jgi:hypothetical protein